MANPSGSVHSIPGGNMSSGGVFTLCYDSSGFSCAGGGYNGTSGQIGGNGWTTGQYWSYGSSGPNGTRHNCTTYAAYRLQQNGVPYPGWTDNANGWDDKAWARGTQVDQTPAVGAIAQWNGGSAGHVAYVEVVTDTYIETTSDSFGGGTDRQRISRTSSYSPDNFIHFKDIGGATANGGSAIQNPISGRCVDVHGASTQSGTQVQLWDCNGSPAQQWLYVERTLRVYANMCLDVRGADFQAGTAVQTWECNGGGAQNWSVNSNGTITISGYCLDATGGGTANTTKLQLWTCNGGTAQRWVGIPLPQPL
jgi:surface antigen